MIIDDAAAAATATAEAAHAAEGETSPFVKPPAQAWGHQQTPQGGESDSDGEGEWNETGCPHPPVKGVKQKGPKWHIP